MNRILLIAGLLMAAFTTKAQYTQQGTIEFERKSNIHRQLDDESDGNDNNQWMEAIKKQMPKFSSAFFNLYFDQSHTIYKPGKEVDNPFKAFWGSAPASENVVYTDIPKQKVTAEKVVYEKKYLVEDSTRHIDWKITDEIRTIANFPCRKAVGKICDSVYVVAFYTDDIMVSGGPEMFGGLPGMILELAIPRLYTTWIATKVEINPPAPTVFAVPAKGKKVTQKELYDNLQLGLKDWGKYAARNIWWSML